jgi:trehalose-phosphatase
MDDLERLTAQIDTWDGQEGGLLLLTDYDGTLTPFATDPGGAWLDPAVRDELAGLATSPISRVAFISGRDRDDLRARVAVPDAVYAGCHGLDIDGPGISFRHPEAEARRGLLEALAHTLSLKAFTVEGLRVEPKRLAVALHTRHVSPPDRRKVAWLQGQLTHGFGQDLEVLEGECVLDVLPRVAWSKAECIRRLHHALAPQLPRPLLPLYLGDDRADEGAFEALAGYVTTVRVGRADRRSTAVYHLDNVTRAHRLLARLAARVAARAA